jgi:hypothetical protein
MAGDNSRESFEYISDFRDVFPSSNTGVDADFKLTAQASFKILNTGLLHLYLPCANGKPAC